MLVLTREEGESLTIGDGIVVTVLKLRKGDVSIGIQAPREVPVVRTELIERPVDPPFRVVPKTATVDGA